MTGERIYLFDTTLRDGAQTQGVDFGVPDKRADRAALDRLGIDYIEGGWPGANPTDDAFFAEPPALKHAQAHRLRHDQAAGPQRRQRSRPRRRARRSGAPVACLVGKTWDFHVEVALGISLDENVAMIARVDRRSGRARRARRCSTPSISSTATRPIPTMRSLASRRRASGRRALARAVRHQWRHAAG